MAPMDNPQFVKVKRFKQNKTYCESTVNCGKSLYEFILQSSDPDDRNIKDKLLNVMTNKELRSRFNKGEHPILNNGIYFNNLYKLDLSMLHKLVFHLCDLERKAPDLHNNLRILKDNRNEIIGHNTYLEGFTDLFTFEKIEELRALYVKILDGIEHLYKTKISDKNVEINGKLNEILNNVEVEVTDLEVEPLLKKLQNIGRCPFKVKIEIKDYPEFCTTLIPLLETLGRENTRVRLQLYKPFFEDVDLQFYDSEKYLTPLLDENSRCQFCIWTSVNRVISTGLMPSIRQLCQ
ncbi:unnamed protein product [Meganyctiphanes norvegica]|uniref:Uncharacterized protein n=1 Tax=Meganyctiphanes norvegica TaxID=48144 RepID=A0AAV2RHQ3_MEGNR